MLAILLACAAFVLEPLPHDEGGSPMPSTRSDTPVPDLEIPEEAIFFLGEVSRGREPQANRRWALLDDGTVLASKNSPQIEWTTIGARPFNTGWEPTVHGRLPEATRRAFLDALVTLGVFDVQSPVAPPAAMKVSGGMSVFVYAKLDGRSTLVEFRPGAGGAEKVREAWRAALHSSR